MQPLKRVRVDVSNKKLTESLVQRFEQAGSKERATKQKQYMRNQFEFYGLTSPERRNIQKDIIKRFPIANHQELIDTIHEMWQNDHRDFQQAGVDLWLTYSKLWTPDTLPHFRYCITTKSWWDTVDMLATNCVGKLLQMHPTLQNEMEDWIEDENIWIRRTALLYQLKYKKETNEERLFRFCTQSMDHSDFFIRKAIGWVLREYSKTSHDAVKKFVEENKEKLSPLSRREASKYLR